MIRNNINSQNKNTKFSSAQTIHIFSQHRKTYNHDEKEMTIWQMRRHRQILLMALSFVFCWAPFGWVYLVKLIGIRDIDSRARSDMVPLLCVKLGSAVINPLIYVFENSKVRSMVKDVINSTFNYGRIFTLSQ